MTRKRSHRLRNTVLGGGVIAAGIYGLLQCDGGLGVLGDGADWAREKAGLERVDAAPTRDAAAEVERCQLRLDRGGLTLAGDAVEVEAAIAACRDAQAADLVVTGDARYGAFEELHDALEAAGIEVYVR